MAAPSATSFETAVRQHEHERHAGIVARLPSRGVTEGIGLPAGWRAEDVLGLPRGHGFTTVEAAATEMGTEPEQILEMVRRGLLETDGRYVRPAVVSVLRVAIKPSPDAHSGT